MKSTNGQYIMILDQHRFWVQFHTQMYPCGYEQINLHAVVAYSLIRVNY